MNNKKLLQSVFVLIITLFLAGCGSQAVQPTETPSPVPPTPTETPVPSTPTPNPLYELDLSTIALQTSDLSSDFQMTENNTSTDEQDVINFLHVVFGWSNTGITNIVRVFENETLASDFFQSNTEAADSNSRFEIPVLGDESVSNKFEIENMGIKIVVISWRYKEAYVFLRYASQNYSMDVMMDESIRLAQQIDARLKSSLP